MAISPSPVRASSVFVNGGFIGESFQINSSSLIFILHVTREKCLQPGWGDNQKEAPIPQGDWESQASGHVIFTCSANILHLFSFGSLKIETFLFSVLRSPDSTASANFNLLLFTLRKHTQLPRVAPCHGKELFVIYHPSLRCQRAPRRDNCRDL